MLVNLFGRGRPLRRLEPCHPSDSVEEHPAAGRAELAALASMLQAAEARNDLIHRASGAGWWELAFDSEAVTYRAQRLHWSLPLRRLLTVRAGWDVASLIAAYLLELAQFGLLWLIMGMAGNVALVPMLAGFGLVRRLAGFGSHFSWRLAAIFG